MSIIKCKFCNESIYKAYIGKHIDSHDISDIEKSKLYQSCLDDSTYTKMLYYTDFINYLFEAKIISTYKEFLKFVQKDTRKINWPQCIWFGCTNLSFIQAFIKIICSSSFVFNLRI